jgi:predicted SAM-dependent methyltransferase
MKWLVFKLGFISSEQYKTEWPVDIVWHNLAQKFGYAGNSVDKIYSSHFLEHLELEKGEAVLRECFRVLKDEGVLRLVVPDLAAHARKYLESIEREERIGRRAHDEFLWQIYGAYLEKKRYGANHRYMYDWPTLRGILEEIGFRRIMRQRFQVSLDMELGTLDSEPENSLWVDAVK